MASSIKSSMSNVAESLDGISSAIEESTNGITTVATNTTDLVAGIEDISSEMTTNEQISNELKDEGRPIRHIIITIRLFKAEILKTYIIFNISLNILRFIS